MTGCRCAECCVDERPVMDPKRLAELSKPTPKPAPKADDKKQVGR